MKIDPRNPPSFSDVVPSSDPFGKTLVLLAIHSEDDGPIYFIVEGVNTWEDRDDLLGHAEYMFEEHNCPTNFIPIPHIVNHGNFDPHGLFEVVDCAWMTLEYEELKRTGHSEYLAEVFPQLRGDPVA